MAAPPPSYGPSPPRHHIMAAAHESTLQKYVQPGTSVIVVYDMDRRGFLVSVTRPNQDGITFRESEDTFPSNELVAKVMMVG